MTSKHYTEERQFREDNIKKFLGEEGKVVFEIVKWDSIRKNYFLYQITENAVLIVRATDKKDFIITKMLARPSRIKRVWEDAPMSIIRIAIENSKDSRRFA